MREVRSVFLTHKPQNSDLVERLDPGYWRPEYDEVLAQCRAPLEPLDSFITHITYGAIVTGREPPLDADGPFMIGQGALRHSGVDLSDCPRIDADSPWVLARTAVQDGDLLIARSGSGSLERNRLAVYHAHDTAVVDCWVDIVRLEGIDPDFVAAFLKTRFGWAQIHRLINGVGPANLSFDEIRSLRVPGANEGLQREISERYADEVSRAHAAAEYDAALEAMRALVRDLEARLGG